MAHSIQVFSGKSAVFNDLDLLAIMGLTLRIIDKSKEHECLRSLANEWLQSMVTYGPGVIDLKLADFLCTPDQRTSLLAVLDVLLDEVRQYQDSIPASVLNGLSPALGVQFSNMKVSIIEAAISKLTGLLAME
jgi:hypothetical protein